MANEEQLALLKASAEGWNKWREREPDQEIDLIGANLGKASLLMKENLQRRVFVA